MKKMHHTARVKVIAMHQHTLLFCPNTPKQFHTSRILFTSNDYHKLNKMITKTFDVTKITLNKLTNRNVNTNISCCTVYQITISDLIFHSWLFQPHKLIIQLNINETNNITKC